MDTQQAQRTKVRRGALLRLCAASLGALALGMGWLTHGPGLCPLRRVAGVPCAGCGLTRALEGLLHGDLHYAWALNPGAFLAVLVGGALGLEWLRQTLRGEEWLAPWWRRQRLLRYAGYLCLALSLSLVWRLNLQRHRAGCGPLQQSAWAPGGAALRTCR